jgi:short-subunit dehydrogenase
MKDIRGKYIWVIGASSGIGAEVAKELADEGAHVALSARSEDDLKKLEKELDGDGHIVAPLDVSDAKAVQMVADSLSEKWPRLDSVIFLAAIYSAHDGKRKPLDFMHKMLDVNIGGAFNIVETVLPIFDKQGQGQIVLCGSVAGYRGLPNGQPYCATKAAIINYAESLKVELEPKNIDVKLISPGFVKTRLTDKNDFDMPMIIEADDAAEAIVEGLTKRSFEIHFPKKFTFIMKFLQLLPTPLYFMITRQMIKKMNSKDKDD